MDDALDTERPCATTSAVLQGSAVSNLSLAKELDWQLETTPPLGYASRTPKDCFVPHTRMYHQCYKPRQFAYDNDV